MARDLRRTRFATRIIGVESDADNARRALELGLVDAILPLPEAISDADVVALAVPVDKIAELLPAILSAIPEGTTVCDLGSAKKHIGQLVENHPRRRNYVAAHPMAGTENSGPDAAMERMFAGKICIVCDYEKSGPQHLALIEKMLQMLGMNIAYMTSDEQDHSTAYISHLPHALAFALANAVQSKEDRSIIFDLASGGFQSTVRLAKSAPDMWGPIFSQNREYVLESLDAYMRHLAELRDSISGDEPKMYELMAHANNVRGILAGENSSLIRDEEKIVKLYKR
jgi:prephenate dehydrogenase